MALIDGLVLYYQLDEVSGAVLDSLSANDGTNTNATPNQAGKIGTAYVFDGTDDYITIDEAPGYAIQALIADSTKSWACWIKIDTTSANPGRIFTVLEQNNTTRWGGGWAFGDKKLYGSYSTPGHGRLKSTADYDSSDGWIHVAFTQNGSAVKLYINGSEDTTANDATTDTVVVDRESLIGGIRQTDIFVEDSWLGTIDEFGIWDKELSSAEVTELYNGGDGISYPFGAVGTNTQINIGDTWKEIPAIQINIGDVWKAVEGMQLNIGDVWKEVF